MGGVGSTGDAFTTDAASVGGWIDETWLGDADSAESHSPTTAPMIDPTISHVQLRAIVFAFMFLTFRESYSLATPAR